LLDMSSRICIGFVKYFVHVRWPLSGPENQAFKPLLGH
jgi:hypothetical protein